jgi:hypothetical protein
MQAWCTCSEEKKNLGFHSGEHVQRKKINSGLVVNVSRGKNKFRFGGEDVQRKKINSEVWW